MVTVYLIFGICMGGCAMHSFYLGRRAGIQSTIEYLIDQELLEVEDEPNF